MLPPANRAASNSAGMEERDERRDMRRLGHPWRTLLMTRTAPEAGLVLSLLGTVTHAAQVQLVIAGEDRPSIVWRDREVPGDDAEAAVLADFALRWLAESPAGEEAVAVVEGWQVAIASVTASPGSPRSAVVAARGPRHPWQEGQREALRLAAGLLAGLTDGVGAGPVRGLNVDDLIERVTSALANASPSTLHLAHSYALGEVAAFFDADSAYLRSVRADSLASEIIARWPARDALLSAVDPFADSIAEFRSPTVVSVPRRDRQGRREVHAVAPVFDRGAVVGALGVSRWAPRPWTGSELRTLRMITFVLEQAQTRADAEQRWSEQAYVDELTGLPNRRAFYELHGSAAADELTVVFSVDVDRLQLVNELVGSPAGDHLLVAVASRLRDWVEPGELVARVGGDEFTVVRSRVAASPTELAGELAKLLAAAVDVGEQSIARPVAIGVACGSLSATVASLAREADIALAAVKAAGGAGVAIFDDAMREQARRRAEVEKHLADVLAEDGLRLFFQPEFDLRTGELVAVEALLRWQHPTLGLIGPAEFLPVATDVGAAAGLGEWVLREACQQWANWRADFPERQVIMRVNVTVAQLLAADFAALVREIRSVHELADGQLCLEIAMTELPGELTLLAAALDELVDSGVGVALDDVGSGHALATAVRSLPVSVLKIDRMFIAQSGETADARHRADLGVLDDAVLAGLVTFAEWSKIALVAKGVEEPLQAARLLRLGCPIAQGNLLSEAVPAAMLRGVVETGCLADDVLEQITRSPKDPPA